MKNLLLITFGILLFACQSQPVAHPASILDDFNTLQINTNNVKSVKEYRRVPSTNSDSLIQPIGLMLMKEFSFDKEGKVLQSLCISCGVQFHSELPYVDLIKRFEYEDGWLRKYSEFEFDTTTYEIQYFNCKSLTKGYRDDQQGYTSLEYYDSIGRLTEQLKFEFFNSYQHGQNIQQVFLEKAVYLYDPETTYRQSFRHTGNLNTVTLTPEQFKILKTNDVDRIEDLADLYEIESKGTEMIKVSRSGNVLHRQMHNTTYPDETFYDYDANELLKTKTNKYNGHEFISEYRYEKW